MEWPKKVFFLCYIAIAGVSSPNCGDKVEVQLLFMAFNIQLIYMSDFYMSDLDEDDIDFTDEQMFLELYRRVEELEKNLEIGLGCDKPDPPEVCNRMIGGKRKRKSRKKRGKGAMVSRMGRKKKHISARQPKQKYVDDAIKILENDQTYLIADIMERSRRIRNLALELEDNIKKGGKRRKRKSRKKRRKRKTKRKRRKSKRRRK